MEATSNTIAHQEGNRQPGKSKVPIPAECPACHASLPSLIDSLHGDRHHENYAYALAIANSCPTCRQYITGHFLGEERLAELRAQTGMPDLRGRTTETKKTLTIKLPGEDPKEVEWDGERLAVFRMTPTIRLTTFDLAEMEALGQLIHSILDADRECPCFLEGKRAAMRGEV